MTVKFSCVRFLSVVLAIVAVAGDLLAASPDPSRSYAILVSGGSKKSSNHLRFWGDMSLAYGTLRRNCGVPRENIRVLWGAGDPTVDLCKAGGKSCSQCGSASIPLNPFDLDRDGVGDIDGEASFENVERAFSEIGSRLTADDQLFVYFTDHGATYGFDSFVEAALAPFSTILLWDGEILTDWMLASWTRNLSCPVILAMECCYSGGMIADMLDSDGIRFLTTAADYRPAHGIIGESGYDPWPYQFFSALRGYYSKNSKNLQERGANCPADIDGDGTVSFLEAARYAYRKRSQFDQPQYAESWQGCGALLFPAATLTADEVRSLVEAHASERQAFRGFRTAHSLKLKGGAVSPGPADGIEFTYERRRLSAPATSADKKGNVLGFLRWSVSPSTADLGADFDIRAPETVFTMPDKAVTFTPTYALSEKYPCRITLWAEGDRPDRDSGAFRWSPDGSAWYRSGDEAHVAAGTRTLRWKSLSNAWKAPSKTTQVKLKAGETYENAAAPAVFTYIPEIRVKVQTLGEGQWLDFPDSGKVSGIASSGHVAVGKSVKLKATAEKGFVFAGWFVEGDANRLALDAQLSFKMPEDDLALIARFVTKEHDEQSMSFSLDGRSLTSGGADVFVETNVMCGVQLNWPIVSQADSVTTVKASGLPSGLSLKRDAETKAYYVTGVPSSPSKVAKKATVPTPSKVKFTMTTAGKNSKTYWVWVTVNPLPAWAYGTFAGFAAGDETGADAGVATLTVASSGKISGKFALGGTNWTYSATGYSFFHDDEIETNRIFSLDGVAKVNSKVKQALALDVVSGWMLENPTNRLGCSSAEGRVERGGGFSLRRNAWKDKALDVRPTAAKKSLAEQGYTNATVKVTSSGAVTYSGKFNDGVKMDASSTTAFLDIDETIRAWMILPMTKKRAGFVDLIEIEKTKGEQ